MPWAVRIIDEEAIEIETVSMVAGRDVVAIYGDGWGRGVTDRRSDSTVGVIGEHGGSRTTNGKRMKRTNRVVARGDVGKRRWRRGVTLELPLGGVVIITFVDEGRHVGPATRDGSGCRGGRGW